VPADMARMVDLAATNDFESARKIHARVFPLMQVNFVESNPVPVKSAMAAMGLLEEVYRLPMVPPRDGSRARIRSVLDTMGLLAETAATAPRR
jgi:4-hydroxy-tetrahydrodipicolinate synthase